MDLGLRILGETDALSSVLSQADALDRPLAWEAELTLSILATPAGVLGAFQRGHGMTADVLVRRASGGAFVQVGPGTIHLALALRSPSVLFPVAANKLVNRYVRPLLRALTKSGASANYFGRDWISVAHRPAGAVGFAHDSGTGRAFFEAFVAIRTPFSRARPSFLGKEPGTLEGITGRTYDAAAVIKAIGEAYLAQADGKPRDLPDLAPGLLTAAVGAARGDTSLRTEPAWAASVDEVIGPVCAGRDAGGVLRLGGDFMASRDAVAKVQAGVARLGVDATAEDVGAIVDESFTAPGVAIEGIRDLGSVRRVLLEALGRA